MDTQKPLAILKRQKNQELILPDVIRSEVNFLIFPFFALSRKGLKDKTRSEYREMIKRGDERIEIYWNVSANPEYGYPGPFDREVHKAVEQIISEMLERDGKVTNPIPLGSLYDLCKRMRMDTFGGAQYGKIREALQRVTTTSVKSRGAFYSKERQEWIEDVFHLYERIVFKESKLPDGEPADTNYLFLGSWYLESLNAFYVKPLDYTYLRSLKSKIASRLYEILGVKFYGLQHRSQRYIWFRYDVLCQLLPIEQQKYYSLAQQVLRSAHDELIKTGFLSKVRWEKKSKTEWLIYYYPGERAKEELESSRPIQEQLQLGAPQESPLDVPGDTPDQDNLVSALQKRGVSRKQAQRLVEERREWINRAIELWELERKKNPKEMKNPAGYLVSIIEAGADWQAPEDYVSAEEKKQGQEKKRRDELIEELVSFTDDDTPPSKLLAKSDKPPTIKELEKEVARIKAEKAKRKQDEKARIEQVLKGLNDNEREAIRTEALSSVDGFLRNSETFQELSQEDIRDWQGSGPVVSPLISKRDEIIRERYPRKTM